MLRRRSVRRLRCMDPSVERHVPHSYIPMRTLEILHRFGKCQITLFRSTFDRVFLQLFTLAGISKSGAGRIVHFSVTNVSSGSGLPYFRGKAQVEDMPKGLGVPYAIIRPTLVFGVGDLLLNNMAWALLRFPVFPVYGSGDYPVQPVYVEDVAAQAVEAGSQSESSVADAAGPDTLSFEALLRLLASTMGVRRWFPHTPPRVGLALTGLVGLLMRDMALTRDEVFGLMDGLLTSAEPPTGTTRLGDWQAENGDGLGRRYVSELRRNFRG